LEVGILTVGNFAVDILTQHQKMMMRTNGVETMASLPKCSKGIDVSFQTG
jgi:hypothetical protein